MPSDPHHTRLSPSQERGRIDSGETGEKVSGIDPAAAPMETDAEAGGSATRPVADEQPRPPPKDYNATAFGSAMRPGPDTKAGAPISAWKVAVLALVAVLVAALLAASLL